MQDLMDREGVSTKVEFTMIDGTIIRFTRETFHINLDTHDIIPYHYRLIIL